MSIFVRKTRPDWEYFRTCFGKQYHNTLESAETHRQDLYSRGKAKEGTLRVYRCPFCVGIHVGSRRPRA